MSWSLFQNPSWKGVCNVPWRRTDADVGNKTSLSRKQLKKHILIRKTYQFIKVVNGVSHSHKTTAIFFIWLSSIANNIAKSLYALRVLRARVMCDSALQAIYQSVINAKLLYASSAWWGFTNATARYRVDGFQRRSIRCGYCPPDLPTFEEQCRAADQKLFVSIQSNTNHLLYYLLPPPKFASQHYDMLWYDTLWYDMI